MAKRYTPNPNNEEAAAALTDTVGFRRSPSNWKRPCSAP